MPPERHSSPSARPQRDRFSGPPSFGGGPRRSFGGPPGGHGGGPPRDSGPRPPFTPRPPMPPAAPLHSVRLREGDREVEVSGTPDFIRQTLDDLPHLLARLRGEAAGPPGRPASISLPPPPRSAAPAAPSPQAVDDDDEDDEEDAAPAPTPRAGRSERLAAKARAAAAEPPATGERPARNGRVRHNGSVSLEDKVFGLLAKADHPLSVASIREQLGGGESGQQIRRILERAGDRVYSTDERPAAYALR